MTLLADCIDFCATHALSESAFGRSSVNDPALLSKMRRGRQVRAVTEERVRNFMAAYCRPVSQVIALPPDLAREMLPHAARRSMTVGQLALRIVDMCVDSDLIDAVMDDGPPAG